MSKYNKESGGVYSWNKSSVVWDREVWVIDMKTTRTSERVEFSIIFDKRENFNALSLVENDKKKINESDRVSFHRMDINIASHLEEFYAVVSVDAFQPLLAHQSTVFIFFSFISLHLLHSLYSLIPHFRLSQLRYKWTVVTLYSYR